MQFELCIFIYTEFLSAGFNEQNIDFVSNDMFAKGKPSISPEAIGLDLNRVQFDVSSHSNDPTVTFPSKVGSSGAFDGLMGNFGEGTYSAPSKGISQIEVYPIDLESESAPQSGIGEDLGNDHKSSGQGSLDFLLKSAKGNHAEMDENHKGVEDGRLEKSPPTSCKFDCIADDGSSGTKTMQSGTDLGGSNISIFNHQCPKSESSQVMETRSVDNEKEESSVGDIHILIQEAVESLLHFSSGSSTSNQDSCTKGESNEAENGVRDQQPEHSLDSYESMVLKLTESSGVDDCCVSSKAPFEIKESDGKDFGIKLRRGRRRLKDFQRDILPALASLSKHEIREDLNIMETVIRSREYKRMRSKMGGGGKKDRKSVV